MKITNKFNLPKALVKACDTERHNAEGCVSATTLLQGAKQIVLTDRHWEELEDDVSDRCWALFGTAVHKLLEESNPDSFTEEAFGQSVNGLKVTGRVDLYDMAEKTVTDYKTASVWKIIFQSFDDWRRQGLIYAWLMNKSGLEVKKCRFVAMLRDWSMSEAKVKADYPKSQVYVYEFDVDEEGLSEIEKFIKSKVSSVKKAQKLDDDQIPACSDEERWAKPTTWAVMKEGRKSAVKANFETKESAEEFCKTVDKGYVEERKGKSVRCEGYCPCREFCSFYKNLEKGE